MPVSGVRFDNYRSGTAQVSGVVRAFYRRKTVAQQGFIAELARGFQRGETITARRHLSGFTKRSFGSKRPFGLAGQTSRIFHNALIYWSQYLMDGRIKPAVHLDSDKTCYFIAS